jgi:hypothetical protein
VLKFHDLVLALLLFPEELLSILLASFVVLLLFLNQQVEVVPFLLVLLEEDRVV